MRFPRMLPFFFAACAQAQVVDVAIRDYKFDPVETVVKRGTTVRWTNHEKRTSHSVLLPAPVGESERMFPGESWQHRFEAPGSYAYTCGPHPEMRGVVVVTD